MWIVMWSHHQTNAITYVGWHFRKSTEVIDHSWARTMPLCSCCGLRPAQSECHIHVTIYRVFDIINLIWIGMLSHHQNGNITFLVQILESQLKLKPWIATGHEWCCHAFVLAWNHLKVEIPHVALKNGCISPPKVLLWLQFVFLLLLPSLDSSAVSALVGQLLFKASVYPTFFLVVLWIVAYKERDDALPCALPQLHPISQTPPPPLQMPTLGWLLQIPIKFWPPKAKTPFPPYFLMCLHFAPLPRELTMSRWNPAVSVFYLQSHWVLWHHHELGVLLTYHYQGWEKAKPLEGSSSRAETAHLVGCALCCDYVLCVLWWPYLKQLNRICAQAFLTSFVQAL